MKKARISQNKITTKEKQKDVYTLALKLGIFEDVRRNEQDFLMD